MKKPIFCTAGSSNALFFARKNLAAWGYTVLPELSGEATHLLLPVPTPPEVLQSLVPEMTVLGGNLPPLPCPSVDLLRDSHYLQENAAITADCALALAEEHLDPKNARVLIIGWGRIGKCLSEQLPQATVAVRREETYRELQQRNISALMLPLTDATEYDLLFNTAPAPIFHQDMARPDAVLIDLASCRGFLGDRVIWARGLPGKMAPAASGRLIAKTALRYVLEKE